MGWHGHAVGGGCRRRGDTGTGTGPAGPALEPAATGGSSVVGVIGKETTRRRWSIGELAQASGLTVRALYHYDEIGLLRAGERTASGRRRYTGHDLRRLYRIRALRALGLSLEEIADVLADPADDLTAIRGLLSAQLDALEAHAERIRQLQQQIHGLLGRIDNASVPDPEQFLTTLETISVFETSFTPEQREQLAERRAALGPEAIEAAKTEWAGLVEELLQHVQDDTPVDYPQVQALADRVGSTGEPFPRRRISLRAAWLPFLSLRRPRVAALLRAVALRLARAGGGGAVRRGMDRLGGRFRGHPGSAGRRGRAGLLGADAAATRGRGTAALQLVESCGEELDHGCAVGMLAFVAQQLFQIFGGQPADTVLQRAGGQMVVVGERQLAVLPRTHRSSSRPACSGLACPGWWSVAG